MADLATSRNPAGGQGFVVLRVNLNEECFSLFFGIFPKFRYFPIGKNRQIPKNRENTEINLKKQPSLRSTLNSRGAILHLHQQQDSYNMIADTVLHAYRGHPIRLPRGAI